MITVEQIALLRIGDTVCEDFISVLREADTKSGKPRYRVLADREKPLLRGSLGAYSVSGAMKYVSWLRKEL